jgi:hypothetical protein
MKIIEYVFTELDDSVRGTAHRLIEQGYADTADGTRALHVWIFRVERQDIVR